MKQFIFLVILTFVLCFTYTSTGVESVLKYYGIEDTINEDLTVNNAITLKFDPPISHLDYQLNFKIYNLTATSNFDLADCKVIDKNEKSLISCDFIGMTSENNLLKLDFNTKSGVNKIDDRYQFSANYGVSIPIDRAVVLVKMPENGILVKEPANESYFPKDGKTLTDGKHIMVYWERLNLTSGDNLQFSILYKKPSAISNYLIVVLTIVIILVMIGVAVYIKSGSKTEDVVKSVLNDDEKSIVDLLNKHGGNAIQKVLVRETDFSKAKVSRLVKNLKERGVIEIEPVSGRENRIILKKAIK